MPALLPGTVSQTTFSLSQTPNFSRTSQNLPVYIVILILVFFYCLSQHEISAGLFCRWTISLDDDDDDEDDDILEHCSINNGLTHGR